ncbi:MAG: hypothetical protein IJ349_08680 [Clostridia bacterium]|nr:hypothetical protein [Clostridia bacterium]
MGKGDYTYGTVQVQLTKLGTLNYGSKFTHTYTSLTASGSVSHEFKSSAEVKSDGSGSLGLTYTRGYVVNLGSKTNSWEIWADNTLFL